MGRRSEVRRVAGPARGVVAHAPRRQVGAEGPGQVARAHVVGSDHEDRTRAQGLVGVEEGSQQVRADRPGSAQVDRLAGSDLGGEGGEALVGERDVEQRPERRTKIAG
jgi:hypothetical protein